MTTSNTKIRVILGTYLGREAYPSIREVVLALEYQETHLWLRKML
jgi:hypothetical protein